MQVKELPIYEEFEEKVKKELHNVYEYEEYIGLVDSAVCASRGEAEEDDTIEKYVDKAADLVMFDTHG